MPAQGMTLGLSNGVQIENLAGEFMRRSIRRWSETSNEFRRMREFNSAACRAESAESCLICWFIWLIALITAEMLGIKERQKTPKNILDFPGTLYYFGQKF